MSEKPTVQLRQSPSAVKHTAVNASAGEAIAKARQVLQQQPHLNAGEVAKIAGISWVVARRAVQEAQMPAEASLVSADTAEAACDFSDPASHARARIRAVMRAYDMLERRPNMRTSPTLDTEDSDLAKFCGRLKHGFLSPQRAEEVRHFFADG